MPEVGPSLHACLRQREPIPDTLLRCRLQQLGALGDGHLAATLMCAESPDEVLGGIPHASALSARLGDAISALSLLKSDVASPCEQLEAVARSFD